MDKGLFPKPVKLSPRIVAWSAAEIAAWQAERIAERDARAV
jgi:predicted DNA-binding transcriptional regulator AlpA